MAPRALRQGPLKLLAEQGVPIFPWAPHEVDAVLQGHRTLGELAGVTKQKQFEIAGMGQRLMREGRNDKARIIFLGLEALDPYDAYVQLALGMIALDDEDWLQADDRFSRALLLNPESLHALYYRGELRLLRLKRRSEGLADLTRAVEKDPKGKLDLTARARAMVSALKRQPTPPASPPRPR
jgi:tetratricopeptide (TPR) repeat protein